MKNFKDLKIGLDEDLQEKLQYLVPNYASHRVLRESIDARKRSSVHQVFTVDVFENGETPPQENYELEKLNTKITNKPIIVGTGPAGLFAALRFVERGVPCVLLERGSTAEKRILGINRYWRYGKLAADDNVCFGEGGAGLYSDGKLITRIKSEHIPYVMHRLVKFGAPAEIQYLANPHVGSDRIRRVIPKLRQHLIENGCEIRFNSKVVDLVTDGKQIEGVKLQTGECLHSPYVLLATGHSAEDVFEFLKKNDVYMEGKSFALGLRIEHPQSLINQIQYRQFSNHPKLSSANYKLAHHDNTTGIGVYSFCMCPGGYVLSSGTDEWGVVCNGMSNYKRNSPFANAAIVVSVPHDSNFGNDTFGGLKFRRQIESAALEHVHKNGGTKQIPVQKVVDFIRNKSGTALDSSSPSGVLPVEFSKILPENIINKLKEALQIFEDKMPGFAGPLAQLHGVESRTSCPLRVTRNEEYESVSHKGLYPCGEGAGYAGGITSAAVDGINCAEAIIQKLKNN